MATKKANKARRPRLPQAGAALLLSLAAVPSLAQAVEDAPPPALDGKTTRATPGVILAQPGQCYARVIIPPRFETRPERQVKVAASTRIEVVPARYETATEQVLVRPEGERIAGIVPAQYRTVTEQVMVKPAGETVTEVPATYRTEEVRTLVKPAHSEWKQGHGVVEKLDDATGAVLCLVEVPDEYAVTKQRVVDTPATTRRVTVPAQYRTVTRQELVRPAEARKVTVPAEYRTVSVQRELSPATTRSVDIPAEYQDVPVQAQVAEGRSEWQPVLCEINATPARISRLQQALATHGYEPGSRAGRLDAATLAALGRFQASRHLAEGGVTLETLQALGVDASAGG